MKSTPKTIIPRAFYEGLDEPGTSPKKRGPWRRISEAADRRARRNAAIARVAAKFLEKNSH